jgi:hypothetical protein
MSRNVYALLSVFAVATHVALAQVPSQVEVSPDIGPMVQVDFPGAGNFDLYDVGLIAEMQLRDWVSHPWGYSLAIGYGEWTVDQDATKPGANLYDYDGELEVTPFGGSVLLKAFASETWSVILDFGVRYMAVNSTITAKNRDAGPDQRYDVRVGDSLLLSSAVGADYAISPRLIWSCGVGYRYDITRGEIKTELGPARDSIMESFFLETGLRLPF